MFGLRRKSLICQKSNEAKEMTSSPKVIHSIFPRKIEQKKQSFLKRERERERERERYFDYNKTIKSNKNIF